VAVGRHQGLTLVHAGHPTRLKWHRLRRSMADPLFSAEVLAEGSRLGASLELDLRVRADGGFVVLHDDLLEGETTGSGPVAEATAAQLRQLSLKDGRPLTLSEDLASTMRSAHPDALLQFDMKDDFAAIGDRGMDHLAMHFSSITGVIIAGASLELITGIRDRLPNLRRGIDPTDKLAAIWRDRGLVAVEADLRADLAGSSEPDMVYLHWQLILEAKKQGLDLVALCHDTGKLVDAWTYTLKHPAVGFSDAEWAEFYALMALRPDQITTDEAPATEAAWLRRMG
jgi:glycerophosphoryl diester phosphodiesterase